LAQCRSRIVRLAINQYVANRDKLHSIWNGTMENSLMVIKKSCLIHLMKSITL
jgi:metal-responsive CopG/Arc/MetJ family transcriptional regulator